MINKSFKSIGADMALLFVAIIWGVTFLPVQQAVETTPVFVFLFYRFLLSTFLMFLFSYKHILRVDKNSLRAGLILGISLFLGFAFQTFGLKFTYSSTVAFITGLNVVIVPFLMFFLFKAKASLFSIFGAFIALFGLYFLSVTNEIGIGSGEILAFICAIMFAFQITLTGHFVKKYNISTLVSIQFLTVTILSLFAALVYDKSLMTPLNQELVSAVLVTAIFATVIAFFVQTAVQRFTTAARTAIIFTFEPVSAGIAGYFFANEILSSWQIFGAALIISGVLVTEVGAFVKEKIKIFYWLKQKEKS